MLKTGKPNAPSLFVSHGAPTVALLEDRYTDDLKSFSLSHISGLKGIICVSAHWLRAGPLQITSNPSPGIVHDFRGFQEELYSLDYPASGSVDLAKEVAEIFSLHNMPNELNPRQKWDHGVWIPLRILRPEADIPLVQVSLPLGASPREILKIGNVLSALRRDGIMILGSGGAAHNLSEISWHGRSSADVRIVQFNEWLMDQAKNARIEELLNYETHAPHAAFAHPTVEHLLPLFVTLGAALPGDQFEVVTEGYQYGSLSMFSFALKGAASGNGARHEAS